MFSIFTDPVKMAQQMEIILNNYGFAIWETLYAPLLATVFAYVIGLPLGILLVTGIVVVLLLRECSPFGTVRSLRRGKQIPVCVRLHITTS